MPTDFFVCMLCACIQVQYAIAEVAKPDAVVCLSDISFLKGFALAIVTVYGHLYSLGQKSRHKA